MSIVSSRSRRLPHRGLVAAGTAVALAVVSSTAALAAGGWTAAAPMTAPHAYGQMAPLPAGKVLYVDSRGGSAEVYDPIANSWTRTGPMVSASNNPGVSPLPDGRVLVAGGSAGSGGRFLYLANAQIYDPKTNKWTATGSMTVGRAGQVQVLLRNGWVLAAAGDAYGDATAEVFIPVLDAWVQTARMQTGHYMPTGTLLKDGRAMVTGGLDASTSQIAATEIYDPSNNTWTLSGSLVNARQEALTSLLPSGNVLVSGGIGAAGNLQDPEVWDPATGGWTLTAPMPAGMGLDYTQTALKGGGAFFAGSVSFIYHPANNTWNKQPSMLVNTRAGSSAIRLQDGRVLVAGGAGTETELFQ